jgi:hypothetical protein
MADKPKQPDDSAKKSPREQRLAAALRENLRRRKAQARARDETSRDKAEPDAGHDG